MGDTERRISSVVTTSPDSSERVAYDLMQHIATATFKQGDHGKRGEEYWLTLYQRCLKATRSNSQG